jgi:NAD(P)-dependent dehydrogenase (short-subunit alcohol dehydrogenase family)
LDELLPSDLLRLVHRWWETTFVKRRRQKKLLISRNSGGRSFALRADVSKEEDVCRMFHRAIDELGTIDVLVSNSGIQRDALFDEMSLEQWNSVI